MAIRPDYTNGTLTLTSGSKSFTTTGSALQVAAVQAGDAIITRSGDTLIIASITGQNSGTLYENCTASAAGAGQPLRIHYQPDGSRYQGAARDLIEKLGSGNLDALSSLTGGINKVPYFTAPGVMELIDLASLGGGGSGGGWDALVGTLSGRDQFNGEAVGFRVLVANNGNGQAVIYEKTVSGWSVPVAFTGPKGSDGAPNTLSIGSVSEGEQAQVIITGDAPNQLVNFVLRRGEKGDLGDVTPAALEAKTAAEAAAEQTASDKAASETAQTGAVTARNKAHDWATAPEDALIDDGDQQGFSAYHWSRKAQAIAGGGVTSVGMSVPAGLSVAGSPITESGTFVITHANGYQAYTTAEAQRLAGIEAGAQVNPNMALYQAVAQRNTVNGYASLDASGKLNENQLPAIAITDTFVVSTQAGMLALSVERGDICVRTDLNKTFVLQAVPATTLANWIELRTPTDAVLSVAGLTGAITQTALRTALGLDTADSAVQSYDTITAVSSANVLANVNAIRTNGYYAAGDGGAALYERAVSEPAHAGKLQSADGAWWGISSFEFDPRKFGALADGSSNASPGIQAAINTNRFALLSEGKFQIGTTILVDNSTMAGEMESGPKGSIIRGQDARQTIMMASASLTNPILSLNYGLGSSAHSMHKYENFSLVGSGKINAAFK